MSHSSDLLRDVDLDGYRLRLWDTNDCDRLGRSRLRYELRSPANEVIFAGADFAASPLYSIDNDETVKALLGFLTLRPGDTDAEYFANYTERQLDFADTDAEALSLWTLDDAPALPDWQD